MPLHDAVEINCKKDVTTENQCTVTRIRAEAPSHLNGLSRTIDSKRDILIAPTYGFSTLCISIVSLIFKIIH